MVLADESTRLKGLRISMQRRQRKDGTWGEEFIAGQGASRAKALAAIAHKKVRYWINATGSPAPNGLIDTWACQWFIDGGRRLGNSFSAFTNRWFRALPGGDGYSKVEPLPYAEREIQALLAETSITVDARDWFPLNEVIERNVYIDLPAKARQHYREMEKELFTEVEQHEVEVFNAGSKAQKCLQIASGSLIHDTDSRAWVAVHDEKIEALKSIVEETNGENLLVTYQFTADRDRILKAYAFPWTPLPGFVSVHVRRTDYLKLAHKHPPVPKEWIDGAMERFPGFHFIFFSDDIPWCEANYLHRKDVSFSKGRSEVSDLIYMATCEHHICSASTFSWWGAWLNHSPNKRVIMPKRWFMPLRPENTSDIVPLEWERI
jgi:hypothetical protein